MVYKLSTLLSSSAKTRQEALDGLKSAMATRLLYEFILERRMTVTDGIERCLKKGNDTHPSYPHQRSIMTRPPDSGGVQWCHADSSLSSR